MIRHRDAEPKFAGNHLDTGGERAEESQRKMSDVVAAYLR